MREAVFENVIAGPAMGRRASYQFGMTLPAGPLQHVDCGLGKATPMGMVGLIPPTISIMETGPGTARRWHSDHLPADA